MPEESDAGAKQMTLFPQMRAKDREIYWKASQRAQQIVCRAVKAGRLANLKKDHIACAECKVRRANHYDHRDYGQPLEVSPVCGGCNRKRGPAKFSVLTRTRHPFVADVHATGFLKVLQREVSKAGTQKQAAILLGVSEQFLSDVLNGRRGPGEKLLSKLSLVLKVSYVKAK